MLSIKKNKHLIYSFKKQYDSYMKNLCVAQISFHKLLMFTRGTRLRLCRTFGPCFASAGPSVRASFFNHKSGRGTAARLEESAGARELRSQPRATYNDKNSRRFILYNHGVGSTGRTGWELRSLTLGGAVVPAGSKSRATLPHPWRTFGFVLQ